MVESRKTVKQILTYLVLTICSLMIIIPIFWMFLTAFKTRVDIFSSPPKLIFHPVLSNFHRVFVKDSFGKYYSNSLIVALSAVCLTLILGVFCGYGLSRLKFRQKEDLAFWILSTRMAPPIAVVIPFFIFWRALGLIDTYLGLIILYILLNLGFVVWILRSFFDEIPMELEEAALIDGCNRFQVLMKIILPVCKPGLMASGLLTFIMCWNEFLFSLVLTSGEMRTAPVAVTGYITFRGINWGPMAAAGVLIILPVLFIALIGQKLIVKGLVRGAIR